MVKGVKNLQAQFARFGADLVEEIEKQLDGIGPEFVAEARVLAPKDDLELERSIGWERVRTRGTFSVKKMRGKALSGRVGIRLFVGRELGPDGENHAIFQEFGTKNMPANPYFFPLWRASRARYRARLNRAAGRVVKRRRKGPK
jgi:hypothetical protein